MLERPTVQGGKHGPRWTSRSLAIGVVLASGVSLAACGSGSPEEPAVRGSTETQSQRAPAATTPRISATAAKDRVLTPRTSRALRSVLKVSDTCDGAVERFAKKYRGRTIRFNGSVVNLMNHGNYTTRYDILIGAGSKGPRTTTGPAMQFKDVNFYELQLTGTRHVSSVNAGDRFQFTANVEEFDPAACLLLLDPVTTEAG